MSITNLSILEELDKLRRKEEHQQPRVYIEPPKEKSKEEVQPKAKEEGAHVYEVDFDIKMNEFDI